MIKGAANKGFGLIEILVGVTIIIIGVLALANAYGIYIKYALANQSNTQAAYLAEEGLEAVTFLRDKSWSTYVSPLSNTSTYYLSYNSSAGYWALTTTAQPYVDGQFLRTVTISSVKRDSSYNIATSGTVDPNTIQATVNVAYFQGHATTTQTLTTYITNIYDN